MVLSRLNSSECAAESGSHDPALEANTSRVRSVAGTGKHPYEVQRVFMINVFLLLLLLERYSKVKVVSLKVGLTGSAVADVVLRAQRLTFGTISVLGLGLCCTSLSNLRFFILIPSGLYFWFCFQLSFFRKNSKYGLRF